MKKLLTVLFVLLMLVGCSGGKKAKYTVGVIQLVQHDALDSATKGFKDALEKEFGDEVDVIVQNASNDTANCNQFATSFVADNVDLILGNATPALQAAAHATTSIPVLGTAITEYGVALDIDNFTGVTGTNVSGTSDLASLEDQAQMIIDLVPSVKTVGILFCKAEANSLYQVDKVTEYLESKGIKVISSSFSDSNDASATADALCEQIDVLYIPTDNTCASNGTLIANSAEKFNVPIFCGEKSTCVAMNGVATLSIDYYNLGVVTGNMAIKILKGEAEVSKMAIEYDKEPVKMFNKDVAEKFGITIPSDFVAIEG